MPKRDFWLSFGDPTTGKNLGVVIIDNVGSALEALDESHKRKCNLGGEVRIYPFDASIEAPRNRKLTPVELKELGESA